MSATIFTAYVRCVVCRGEKGAIAPKTVGQDMTLEWMECPLCRGRGSIQTWKPVQERRVAKR